jgi:mono/diheme cytochrome c family protein
MIRFLAAFLAVLALAGTAPAQCRSYCRTATATYTAPTAYQATYATATYYNRIEYVPTIIEVNVNKDRYYSLSDLTRDRLYLEMFDMLRERRAGQGVAPAATPAVGQAEPPPPPVLKEAKAPKGNWGKSTDAARKVVADNCLKCHGKGSEPLDLSDLDAVSPRDRAAAFALVSTGDMPPPPKALLAVGKEADLKKWKEENALKDADLEPLYAGWVSVGRNAALAAKK